MSSTFESVIITVAANVAYTLVFDMPSTKDAISWLSSPKRRRTTSQLKTIPDGRVPSSTSSVSSRTTEFGSPKTRQRSGMTPPTHTRPPAAHRPFSQPATTPGFLVGEGNLFYAYARRENDQSSRYLLTFATATVANEWWLLLQIHFPDTSRLGPQLFVFSDEQLLSKAWRHSAFEHLKSKWMYISFADADTHELGGATQSIIPVQDSYGNVLGGSAPTSPHLSSSSPRRQDVGKLEEYFEGLMSKQKSNREETMSVTDSGYFGTDAIGTIHERMMDSQQPQSDPDLSALSGHLEKIQSLMEQMASQRATPSQPRIFDPLTEKLSQFQMAVEENSALLQTLASGREDQAKLDQRRSQALDLSPLNEYLSLIHGAIEQQSTNMDSFTRWAVPSTTEDMSSLPSFAEQLQQIHSAIEESNQRTPQATPPLLPAPVNMSGLEKSINSLRKSADSNAKQLREMLSVRQPADKAHQTQLNSQLDESNEHLRALREWTEYDSEHIRQILELQRSSSSQPPIADHEQERKLVQNRMDRMDSQIRELMSGQRELVEVMRSLAESITAANKGQCDHVVVPPPRKMGRKIVGFVYDAKER